MQIYVGMDGGGSRSRAQAQLAEGPRTEVFLGGPANIFSDPDGAECEISTLLQKTLAAARALESRANVDNAMVVLGLAGAHEAGLPAREALRSALPYPNVHVLGDVDIAVAGALRQNDGIVAAIGTGSVIARQLAGTIHNIGGYGFALGDEASGAWMGHRALQAVLHAHDGLVENGPLSRDIRHRFASVAKLLDFARTARPADYASLAPVVLEHDMQGCPLAQRIIDDACAYLLRAIRTLQGPRLDLPIIGMGGLGDIVLDRLIDRCERDLLRAKPVGNALDGALWIARNLEVQSR